MEFTKHKEILETHILSKSVQQSLVIPSAVSYSSIAPSYKASSAFARKVQLDCKLALPAIIFTPALSSIRKPDTIL